MKTLMKAAALAAMLFSASSFAGVTQPIPEDEFLQSFANQDLTYVEVRLGEPDYFYQYKNESGEVIATDAVYKYVTMQEDGTSHPYTQFSFTPGNKVSITFLNSYNPDAQEDGE